MEKPIEHHPLTPFLPQNSKILLLGSFPPKHDKWSMEFFYPNFQNDMWRIMGLIFFANKNHFIQSPSFTGAKAGFHYQKIVEFCNKNGIAIYDTASAVIRLKDNASDKFLEVVESTDIPALLARIPDCRTIVTTGQKATDTLVSVMGCQQPNVGEHTEFVYNTHTYQFFRMPSSSRAYPLSVEKKAEYYRKLF